MINEFHLNVELLSALELLTGDRILNGTISINNCRSHFGLSSAICIVQHACMHCHLPLISYL